MISAQCTLAYHLIVFIVIYHVTYCIWDSYIHVGAYKKQQIVHFRYVDGRLAHCRGSKATKRKRVIKRWK
jgi:hypothetical protein